jgi:ATP/maltotriose-dependent transcriptional regulator MalT
MAKVSDLEYAFDTQFKRLGSDLPEPKSNVEIIPDRKFQFDRVWEDERLAVEIEGGSLGRRVSCQNCGEIVRAKRADGAPGREIRIGGAHQTTRFTKDIEKYNLAAQHGWTLLRFTRKDVLDDPFSMVEAIRKVILKKTPPMDLVEPITIRERQVLYLIASGMVTIEIANRLGVAETTIRGHAQNLCQKLCVRNRSAAVARAAAWGIIDFKKVPFPTDIEFLIED